MMDADRLHDSPDPTATGILLCLRMLADEAADLKLQDTLTALRLAISTCEAEYLARGLDSSSVH